MGFRTTEILRFVTGPDVLDVGCTGHSIAPTSTGWLHGALRNRFRVTGVDISAENIAALEALGFQDLHVQSAESFQFNKKFDTIVAGEVIEHLSNPAQFLQRARDHLKPSGRIVLSTPHPFCLMYVLYAGHHFPKTCENSQHTFWFCLSTLRELASRADLEVTHWCLADDYSKSVRSMKYRAYWAAIRTVGVLLPEWLRKTTLVAVLEPRTN